MGFFSAPFQSGGAWQWSQLTPSVTSYTCWTCHRSGIRR
jgi:hypothetical protein